jgi:peptidoglycan/xylan/chitin deacetylase (PgdA/CDA1 family)
MSKHGAEQEAPADRDADGDGVAGDLDPSPTRHGRRVCPLAAAAVVTLGSLWLWGQTSEGTMRLLLVAALLLAIATVAVHVLGRVALAPRLAAASVLIGVGAGCWIGANSPYAGWFGSQIAHGSRGDRRVALTFDDGPNDSASLAIARLLDAAGAKGTFFVVGKAVARRPAIVRALVADGQLVANHSYRHDSKGWLDPRYPELARTQRTIDAVAHVCPAFYRAPHGAHTPLLAFVVHRHQMTMVGWDVSAHDWDSQDAATLARRVLSRVRPGSIIDLHDGLDGDVTADRHVLVEAMPAILRGLAERGLRPVRLDELLGHRGYTRGC